MTSLKPHEWASKGRFGTVPRLTVVTCTPNAKTFNPNYTSVRYHYPMTMTWCCFWIRLGNFRHRTQTKLLDKYVFPTCFSIARRRNEPCTWKDLCLEDKWLDRGADMWDWTACWIPLRTPGVSRFVAPPQRWGDKLEVVALSPNCFQNLRVFQQFLPFDTNIRSNLTTFGGTVS